ncbi:MAG: hypothetical protein QXI12_10670 [Candidatus Methanomethyliaceae archaeon]
MHYLHCILVSVETPKGQLAAEKLDELKRAAKETALDETEEFGEGLVFDWRADGPGRWAEKVPDVILGAENPEEFLEVLREWSEKPFKQAVWFYDTYIQPKFPQGLVINKQFLADAWEEKMEMPLLWALDDIVPILQGDYTSASHFYSVPDRSCKLSSETLKKVRKHPEKYALVFFDIHN